VRILVVSFLLALGAACGVTPLETEDRVDAYLSRGDVASACGGLLAREERVREHTAKRIVEFPKDKAGRECLAKAVYDGDKGTWDATIASALSGARIEAPAAALAVALDDNRIQDKVAVAKALGAMMTKAGWTALLGVAEDPQRDEDLRAASVAGMVSSKRAVEVALPLLDHDPSDAVRAAAASALAKQTGSKARKALVKAASEDASGTVRREAIVAMGEDPDGTMAKALCEIMLEDEDPGVRAAAVRAFDSTLSQSHARCLAKKLEQGDDDGTVRQALLDALKGSPTPASAQALCGQIGTWLKRYGKGKNVYEIPGADIVTAQNFRDFDNSFDCVAKARRTSGLSCYARNYLAHWVNDLGFRATTPNSPGMAKIK